MRVEFADALKAFRRGAHVHGRAWRAVMMCQNPPHLAQCYQEVLATLQASSVGVANEYGQRRIIETNNGATMRFCVSNSLDDVELHLKGTEFTHIIWSFDPDHKAMDFAETRKRSATVAPEAMQTHIAIW